MSKEVLRDQETIEAAKFLKNERRRQGLANVFKYVAKNAIPRGIHNPDDRVTNLHLYVPGMKHPKKTKLF